jgi:DNA-binding response OmpR family regulator
MDGFELAELIKVERPGVSIVMMSGAIESETLAATRGLAFLPKPFLPDTLTDLVRGVLSSTPTHSNDEVGVGHGK